MQHLEAKFEKLIINLFTGFIRFITFKKQVQLRRLAERLRKVELSKRLSIMKNFLISGLVDEKYRIKVNLLAISPDHAIKVFQQKYPKAEDIYVIQNLFNR